MRPVPIQEENNRLRHIILNKIGVQHIHYILIERVWPHPAALRQPKGPWSWDRLDDFPWWPLIRINYHAGQYTAIRREGPKYRQGIFLVPSLQVVHVFPSLWPQHLASFWAQWEICLVSVDDTPWIGHNFVKSAAFLVWKIWLCRIEPFSYWCFCHDSSYARDTFRFPNRNFRVSLQKAAIPGFARSVIGEWSLPRLVSNQLLDRIQKVILLLGMSSFCEMQQPSGKIVFLLTNATNKTSVS